MRLEAIKICNISKEWIGLSIDYHLGVVLPEVYCYVHVAKKGRDKGI